MLPRTTPPQIFNRRLLRTRQHRLDWGKIQKHKLHQEVGQLLTERLSFIRRTFEQALIIGDLPVTAENIKSSLHLNKNVQGDSEFLPFDGASFDLVISYFDMHYHNDIPGSLRQINHVLKPDGLFLGIFLGGDSLWQLRLAVQEAEENLRGGVSPRVAPMVSLPDAAALLQRAEFALPVADHERISLTYNSILEMLLDLKSLGLSNIHMDQHPGLLTPSFIQEIGKCYKSGTTDGGEETFPLTFDVVFLSGWAPDESQPKPLRRGSGQLSLSAVL